MMIMVLSVIIMVMIMTSGNGLMTKLCCNKSSFCLKQRHLPPMQGFRHTRHQIRSSVIPISAFFFSMRALQISLFTPASIGSRQKPSFIPFLPPLHLAVASHLRSASGTLVRAPLIIIPSLLPRPLSSPRSSPRWRRLPCFVPLLWPFYSLCVIHVDNCIGRRGQMSSMGGGFGG